MLGQRIITALILLPLAIWGIFELTSEHFALVLAVVFLIGGTEWCRMAKFTKLIEQIVFIGALAGLMWYGWLSMGNNATLNVIIWVAVLWWVFNILMVVRYPQATSFWYGSK
ncbi:MAG: phosphatidate cytidylyltransferase, partial [Gammaproteobacteria bacterium]|nr:phosphatidate cytidylyltransferase [Gammaproteobacteria bacterium]